MNLPSKNTLATNQCLPSSFATEEPWCFAGILEKLEDAVIILNCREEAFLFCNLAAETILSSLQLTTSYQSLSAFLHSRNIDLTLECHEVHSQSIIHNDRIIEFSQHAMPDDFICFFIRDITEKKRLESIAQSINTMDNLGFIFSGIRHEIGNPLNSIKMTNSVLQKNLERFSRDDISKYIDRTAYEISRMEYLLKSLKNFSLYEKVDCSAYGLKDFLETLLVLIEPDLEKKSIQVQCEPPASDVLVNIDPRGLHQAILNIITNAADALTSAEGATISISTKANGRLAWIIIEDNGCGMSEEQLKMLFHPFHTNKAHGNGLGLVITQKLITMMQATLDISSNLGRGTTARIGLPLAKMANKDEPT